MLSRLALVSGLAPILAPVIGSQLMQFADWRGLFVFLALYGIAVIIGTSLFVVETLPRERRAEPGHSTAGQRYRALMSDRVFVGVVLVGAMNFAGLFSYLSSSPFLFQGVYSFDPQQYGLLFAVNSLGIVAGVQLSSRLQRHVGPQWVLAFATVMQLVASVSILALDESGAGLVGLLVPLWFYIFSAGLIFPAVQVLALANHGTEAGTAASVLGAVNFGMAGLVSPIVGLFTITDAVPMAAVMATAVLIAIAALWLIVQPRTVPALSS
jgi:DHA1 family bicyclomycin/chloramphenicol resistance-like MFS transporter